MLQYITFTDKGNREINEDSVGVFEKDGTLCAVLCDGLGGHGRGEVASAMVVDTFKTVLNETKDYESFLACAFQSAEDALLAEQERMKAKQEMKTTGVGLLFHDGKVQWGHVGDSRLYAFKRNKVKTRTLDHSVPQMLVLSREIKEKQIRNHPDRNRLLKVIGIEWERPQYEISDTYKEDAFQAYLLCSDGFWELIEEKQMEKLLKKSKTVEEWVTQMAEIVKANGVGKNMDNYSAIAVWYK